MELMRPLRLEADSYTNEYFVLGDKFFLFRRSQEVLEEKEMVDVFGGFWAFAIGDLRPGQVAVRRGDEWVQGSGRCLAWIPPFSTMQWRLQPGPLEWHSYLSLLPVPVGLPSEPCLISCKDFNWPRKPEDISELFRNADWSQRLSPISHNPWARRLRVAIEKDFRHNHKIEDYAVEFGVSAEVLTRAFHDEFGIPPVQYRNRMRLSQAMIDILMTGKQISEISHSVGFNDPSHFHQLFRREIRSTPKKFRF